MMRAMWAVVETGVIVTWVAVETGGIITWAAMETGGIVTWAAVELESGLEETDPFMPAVVDAGNGPVATEVLIPASWRVMEELSLPLWRENKNHEEVDYYWTQYVLCKERSLYIKSFITVTYMEMSD